MGSISLMAQLKTELELIARYVYSIILIHKYVRVYLYFEVLGVIRYDVTYAAYTRWVNNALPQCLHANRDEHDYSNEL